MAAVFFHQSPTITASYEKLQAKNIEIISLTCRFATHALSPIGRLVSFPP
ncbi:hypothetical protein MJ923_12360 [Shewanella sp. 3B26]|uniref:Uncharacterized protein n=1 Tax=Shewanella zhuhaiensis TaxID=2919576 RepID=A0AAJ1BJW7_9GAMM|nr:hypothetical protein [Shewanella zhuhaiensis]